MVESERLSRHHSSSVASDDVTQHQHFRMDTNQHVSNNDDEKKEIFSQLPNEIIFDQILVYFEYQWILNTARLVCKLWNDHHKTIKTNQFTIKYNGNIEKIILLMNEHSDELHQVTQLIVYGAKNDFVELERQFFSKLINLQHLKLHQLRNLKDCDVILEFVKLQNLKKIDMPNFEYFREFTKSKSRIKSINVYGNNTPNSQVDFSNLNWPLEEFRFEYLTSESIKSLLKNEIMTKNLNKLEIPHSRLDENVMKEMSTLSNLKMLNLNSVECGDDQVQYISKLENIESIMLFDNSISGIGLCNFGNLTNITKLNIEYNLIDNEGANYLSSLTSLKYLYLTNNNISDKGLKNYCKLSNLLELYLNNNQIGSIGANYISQITSITCLTLNNNLIGEEGLKNFGNLLNLKTLHLGNNQIGNGFEYLSNCKNISTLDVSNNNIREESVMKYCENKMKPLVKQLYISKNPIGNFGFTSLLKLPKLTTIGANNCEISDKGISKMLKIIRFKKSITLHLESNYLTNKSLKKMIKSKHINNIQHLKISSTNSELDSNYLKILSEKLESEDKKNRCIVQ